MGDEVKFIFKTLIKVPFVIFVVYLIFNLFAFSFTYFRLLGFSYVVMQTAVENNYLPETEYNSLDKYLGSISNTGVVDNASIIIKNPDGTGTSALVRQQYGSEVTVGVEAHYRFILPLGNRDQQADVTAEVGSGDSGDASAEELQGRRDEIADNPNNNIRIFYTVPGLKYYPDLS